MEIETKIEQLHQQTRAAVEAMKQGRDKARTSVASASNAASAFTEITTSVETIVNMNLEIASACEQQSAVAVEIRENAISINQVADSNACAADRLSSSSDNLAEIATGLEQMVSQFRH